MKKNFFYAAIISVLFFSLFSVVQAGGLGDAGGYLQNAVKDTGLDTGGDGDTLLTTSVGTVIKAALALVGTIFFVLTIYAGILWMTAAGEEEKVTKAKNIIIAAVIGLFIVMSAYAITAFVTAKLGVGTTQQPEPSGDGGGGNEQDAGGA